MAYELTVDKERGTIALDGDLTIYEAEALKAELSELVGDSAATRVDLSQINHTDSAGLQLLYAYKAHQQALGNDCQLINASESVRKGIGLYQLNEQLIGEDGLEEETE